MKQTRKSIFLRFALGALDGRRVLGDDLAEVVCAVDVGGVPDVANCTELVDSTVVTEDITYIDVRSTMENDMDDAAAVKIEHVEECQ